MQWRLSVLYFTDYIAYICSIITNTQGEPVLVLVHNTDCVVVYISVPSPSPPEINKVFVTLIQALTR